MPTLMTQIINKNHQGYPVLKDSVQLNDFDTICQVSEMDNETLIHGTYFGEMDNMGGSWQVECYVIQHKEENDNDVVNGTQPPNTYCKEVLPLF